MLYESQQSNTSPVKYHLVLSLEELEQVTDLIAQIIQIIKQKEKDTQKEQA